MRITFSILLFPIIILFILCTNDTKVIIHQTILSGFVLNASDSSAITNANVIVYDANTNAPVTRTFTNIYGYYTFELDPATYYLKVSAQGYLPSPPKKGTALSFQVFEDDTTWKNVYLDIDISSVSCGSIAGAIRSGTSGVGGVLIIASDTTNGQAFSGTSGPNGYYIIFNVKPGTYSIECFIAGYVQSTIPVIVTVVANSTNEGNNIALQKSADATLSGHISFLASPNSIVDITLIHPVTREAVPGLSTFNESSNTYQLAAIPPGTYIAWASYRNDGYVMDPDRISKFGLPYATIADTTTTLFLNFEVTDAVGIVSPSNHPDTVLPTMIMTTSPTFIWTQYPSAKEYILEVTDSHGDIIWGGFDTSGVIQHTQVSSDANSTVFNFDGGALDSLHIGETYRWKIYADNDATLNVQGLISASEDLLGIFKVIADTSSI